MNKQPKQGGTPKLVDQSTPATLRKKNAWWRQPKLNRAVRRLPYVISEGEVWFGRKVPGGKAWVWLEASDEQMVAIPASNDKVFRRRG